MKNKVFIITIILFFMLGPVIYSLGDFPPLKSNPLADYFLKDSYMVRIIKKTIIQARKFPLFNIPGIVKTSLEEIENTTPTQVTNHYDGLFSISNDVEIDNSFDTLNFRTKMQIQKEQHPREDENYNQLWAQFEITLPIKFQLAVTKNNMYSKKTAPTPRNYHQWPLSGGVITSVFGSRIPVVDMDSSKKSIGFHHGIDIAGSMGSLIRTSAAGIVLYAGKCGNYGNTIIIKHGNGDKTLYGHLNHIYVKTGDIINQLFIIGSMGSTGLSTGPHLHFEISRNGNRIDPIKNLPALSNNYSFSSYFLAFDKIQKKYVNI